MKAVRVRFAPSPTGVPHIGNTRTALFNYLFARHEKGKFILRIEDTDRTRFVPGSLEKILQILKEVGIKWDEGPYIQSQRLKIYQDYAHQLVSQKKAYYCFCSKTRLAKLHGQGYDGHCLKLSSTEINLNLKQKKPYVIRLKVPKTGVTSWQDLIQGKIEFQNHLIDDQVLLKSDGYPTYHLAVVIDDYLMKISHVLRGAEWISSTPKHLLLYQAFGWPVPQIGHFSVILGPDRTKLSKRHGAKSLLDYLAEGYLVQALISFMAYLGWSYHDNSEVLTLSRLIELFDLKKVRRANPIFDIKKLDYFNSKLIRQTPDKLLVQLIKPYLRLSISDSQLLRLLPLLKDRLIKLTDINDLADFFPGPVNPSCELILDQIKLSPNDTKKVLTQSLTAYKALKSWQNSTLESLGHQLLIQTKLSPRQLFMMFRVVLTAKTKTPPLFDIMAILGKAETIKRFKHAQNLF